MIRFEDLVEKVRAYSPEADLELLRRAYVFSAFEHKGQVRHSGEPYMVHPLEVADFLADMRLDVVAVAAGLLHDVVEDTLTTIERIEELFGAEVAHVVEMRLVASGTLAPRSALTAEFATTREARVAGALDLGIAASRPDAARPVDADSPAAPPDP